MPILIGYSNVTERLKQVVALAEIAAQAQREEDVTPLHLMLGLIDEGEGVAATALQFHGFSLGSLRDEVKQLLTPGRVATMEWTGLEAAAGDAVLKSAHAEAMAFGHRYIGTEHLLLGLLSDSHTSLAQLFEARGFGLSEARARIRWILESDPHNPLPYISAQAV